MVQLGHLVLTAPARVPDVIANPRRWEDDKGHQGQRGERQPPVQVNHYREQPQEREDLAQQIGGGSRNRGLNLIRVVRDHGHQLARWVASEKRHRLVNHARVEQVPQVADHRKADEIYEICSEKLRRTLDQRDRNCENGNHRPDVVEPLRQKIL